MKKTILFTSMALALGVTAQAQSTSSDQTITAPASEMDPTDRPFEAGVIFGEPTGLSLKYWLNETMAIDGGLGWSFKDDTDLHLHSDLLWHNFEWLKVPEGQLPVYFGVGARAKFRDNRDDLVGIRLPIGVNYLFADVPVSLFVEVAPVLDLAPSTRGGITAGIGARYRF